MERHTEREGAAKARGGLPLGIGLTLLAVLLLAGGIRFYGLRFGLPHKLARPDEQRITSTADSVLEGRLEPLTFRYPGLLPYANAAVRWLAGLVTHTGEEAAQRLNSFSAACLTSRVLSAALGTLTAAAVFFLGRRAFSPGVGLLSAVLLALCHLHARDSHFGVTDVPLTFFMTLALLPSLTAAEKGTWRATLLSGFLAGLAFSTKYSGLLVLAPVAAAHAFYFLPRRIYGAFVLRLAVAGGIFLATFILTNPYALMDSSRFLAELKFELRSKTAFQADGFTDRGWIQHALLSLRYGLGLPFCLAAAAGFILAFVRRRKGEVLVALFVVVYYLCMGSGTTIYVRYMVPLTPCAAVLAAFAIHGAASRMGPPLRWILAAALLAVAVSLSAGRTYHTCRLLAGEDTRLVAARVLSGMVGDGERALILGRYTAPADALLKDERFVFEKGEALESRIRKAGGLRQALEGRFDYVVFGTYFFESRFAPNPKMRSRLRDVLKPVDTISPLQAGCKPGDVSPVFNRRDKLYLPYARFSRFDRAGPFIHIYKVPVR